MAVIRRGDVRHSLNAGDGGRAVVQGQRALAVDCTADGLAIEAETAFLHGVVVEGFLALGGADYTSTHAEVTATGSRVTRCTTLRGLAAETEQAVLAGRQTEAGQGHRVDLALGQIWR